MQIKVFGQQTLPNIANYLPINKLSDPRRREYLSTQPLRTSNMESILSLKCRL